MAKALDTICIEINDKEYFSTDWSTRKSYANLFKLGRLFAPISSLITEVMQGGEKLQEVIPAVMLFVCEELDDKGFEKLFNMVAEDVTGVGGVGKLDMDDLDPDEVIQMLTKLLEQHYKVFFQKAVSQVKDLIEQTMKVATLDQNLNKPKTPAKKATNKKSP